MTVHSTEYLAVPKGRLIRTMLLLFVMGVASGLLAGYLIWSPSAEPDPKPPRPQDPTIREAS